MDNRIMTKEDMLFAPHEPAVAPKKEKSKKTPKPKLYNYEVGVHISDDKNNAMQTVYQEDSKAEFKHKSRWRFKVRTTLTLNDMNRIFMYKRYEYAVKKTWFF